MAPVKFSPSLILPTFHKLLSSPFPPIPPAPSSLRSPAMGTSTPFKVAATQMAYPDLEADGGGCTKAIEKARDLVIKAVAEGGADVVLLQELFTSPYFCQEQNAEYFPLALPAPYPLAGKATDELHPFFQFFSDLAKQYKVVLPISFYEEGAPNSAVLFNSVIVIDSDGKILPTLYRKTHIPDGPGYSEKFYFSPGDTGPKVFTTKEGWKLGIGICWDQWFPELARSMSLLGADVLLYPTAIGTEPQDPTIDSSRHWRRCMVGHGGSNCVPVVASNRVGTEALVNAKGVETSRITFYGTSFATDTTGEVVADLDRTEEGYCVTEVDVNGNKAVRQAWGLMRDRRPEMYGLLGTKTGGAAV